MIKNDQTKIKILDESLKGGFTQLPRMVLRAKGLSMQAKTLYSLLLDYAWQKDSCFPGQDRLAEDLDVHRNTITKYLSELKKFGLITWKRRGFQKTNVYYILPLKNIFTQSDAQGCVNHDSQGSVHHVAQALVHKEYKEEYKKGKYKQPLTLGEENVDNFEQENLAEIKNNGNDSLNSFDPEAVQIAKELGDIKNIRYFQKLIHRRNKGEITDEDIQSALNDTRRVIKSDQLDGTNFLKNPGAWFTSKLKSLTRKREHKRNTEKLNRLKEKLLANSAM